MDKGNLAALVRGRRFLGKRGDRRFRRICHTLASGAQGFEMTVLYHAGVRLDAETILLYKARHCSLDKLLDRLRFFARPARSLLGGNAPP
jgi:hypothetical protein